MTSVHPPDAEERQEPRARRRPSGFTITVSTVAGALLLLFTVPNMGSVIRAARADGTPGTFTAEHLSCIKHGSLHESCTWYGSFEGRPDHYLYGAGRDTMKAGESAPAVDVGRGERVYDPDGSREWIPNVLMIIAGLVLLVPLARALRHLLLRRRSNT